MRDTTLLQLALGLTPPWTVTGSDFDAELKLKNIDFGTFHSYPDWWSKTVEWTVQWIEDHGAAMRGGKKPVVHEEYGEFREILISNF